MSKRSDQKRPDPKAVDRACYEALSTIGVRLKYGLGSLPIEDGFLGWIGLNQGTHPTFVRVNPNIGIHCIPLMKLVADATGEKYRTGEFATVSYPLGLTCPHVEQFIFDNEVTLLPEAQRLTEAIKQFGIPFIRSLASYDALLPRIREGVESLGAAPERYAAGLYLNGDTPSAFNFLNENISRFSHKGLNAQAEELRKLKRYLESVKNNRGN